MRYLDQKVQTEEEDGMQREGCEPNLYPCYSKYMFSLHGAMRRSSLTWSLLPVVVRYGKLLLDTDRSLSLPLSPPASFSLPRSPNQGKGRQEGMEVTEPDGETPAGSSTRSPQDPLLENNSYSSVKMLHMS